MPVEWDDQALRRRIERTPQRIDAALAAIINRHSPLAETWMKQHAPWTDRTGNARQGLHATPVRQRYEFYMIVLAHAVSYGIWLEVANSSRYEIIKPALNSQGDAVMRSVANVFQDVFGGGA